MGITEGHMRPNPMKQTKLFREINYVITEELRSGSSCLFYSES